LGGRKSVKLAVLLVRKAAMRISTKLTLVVVAVFLIVGAVGALALERMQDAARRSIESEARHLASAMATLASLQIADAGADGALRARRFQSIIDYMSAREQRDLEVVDPHLIILADVTTEHIGTPIEEGERRAVIARTLADGQARLMTEAASAEEAEMHQVVVPVRGAAHAIVAALVYEYTPLIEAAEAQTRDIVTAAAWAGLLGLALALAAVVFISRTVATPLARLSGAALQLARGGQETVLPVLQNDEIGELTGIFNAMSAALHVRERAMASTFNGIMIADLSASGYPLVYVNQAFERITGYPAQEAIGMPADFLVGADQEQPALQELRLALREGREAHAVLRSYRKSGEAFWNEVYIAPVRSDAGPSGHFVAIFSDITDARNDADQLAHQAQFDLLTGLANRSLFLDRVRQAITTAPHQDNRVVLAFIDLDDFKLINDNLGHAVGDQLLVAIAARLQACVRPGDTVARFGGDEFVLLLLGQEDGGTGPVEARLSELARAVLERVAEPILLAGHEIKPSCSIGLAGFPHDGTDADTLIKHADTAMYRAKELGRNGFQFFTQALQARAQQQLELGASVRRALEQQQFELFYQPQVSLRSGRIVGVEALLRWRHPRDGLLGPAHFIAFAEETGLILPIGAWVLRQACLQNKAWQDAGLPPLPVAVNISARQCAQQDLERVVRDALEHSGLAPHYLELELTESISMADPEQSVPMMERMKAIGVELSIDDFGTGYSNMSYLKRFPIDRLKLDISFVREITTDPSSLAISDAIITMSHSLHLEVVAEGVETEGQVALLALRQCDIVQGYFFSEPLTADGLAALLREDRRLPGHLIGRLPNAPILLVLDDDTQLLAYLDLVLSNEGYSVQVTSDPDQAFEILACQEVAVLLCDQRMPLISGVEFLSRARSMHPDTVRIMLSAYGDAEEMREAINKGAVYKYIEKPPQAEQLSVIVAQAYRQYAGARQPQAAALMS
jgi:diguanylate cyclase (GGDEF)-like protein/PAS domain S-box-containing protein